MTITVQDITLPHGITLSCRVTGPEDAPVLMFLHGFPEAAFVWDPLLEHFAGRYRCVAPNLRGYERSSTPAGVEPYRAKHLIGDIRALVGAFGGRLAALVAHDWGGAVAWTFTAAFPALVERLFIVNSPHPAVFLRELLGNPVQQAASAYMNDFNEPGSEDRLAADDFAMLWHLFDRSGATDPDHPGGGWLTDEVRAQYRAVWSVGLTGPVNYYRASPLRPHRARLGSAQRGVPARGRDDPGAGARGVGRGRPRAAAVAARRARGLRARPHRGAHPGRHPLDRARDARPHRGRDRDGAGALTGGAQAPGVSMRRNRASTARCTSAFALMSSTRSALRSRSSARWVTECVRPAASPA